MDGWNVLAAQENLEHQRMIYSMRCYLNINCCNLFSARMLSNNEYYSLKTSFTDRENYITHNDEMVGIINYMSQEELDVIITTTSDKLNSEKFYKKIMSQIIGDRVSHYDKEKVMDVIIQKCRFTID